jgi:putative transposase
MLFESIEQVHEVTETWFREYNEERPHSSIGRVPPVTFMPRPLTVQKSSVN